VWCSKICSSSKPLTVQKKKKQQKIKQTQTKTTTTKKHQPTNQTSISIRN
jgi:hypothetical protein